MSNDLIYKNEIEYYKKIVDKLENYHEGKRKYELLYKLINYSLRKDFKMIDEDIDDIKSEQIEIPNKFWIMWWQGINQAPALVYKNICSLQKIFGENNVVIINKNNYKKYTNINPNILNKFSKNQISITTLSDIIRFNILKLNGGYWIDSTVVISDIFKKYFDNVDKKYFFTLSTKSDKKAYRNISYSKWTLWFLGGVPDLNFFRYMDKFYEIYFSNHQLAIDYFLTDDVIAHYYATHNNFRDYCRQTNNDWNPYLWWNNFNSLNISDYMMECFSKKLKYSVQKVSYKFEPKLLENRNNFISYLLNY